MLAAVAETRDHPSLLLRLAGAGRGAELLADQREEVAGEQRELLTGPLRRADPEWRPRVVLGVAFREARVVVAAEARNQTDGETHTRCQQRDP